MKIDSSQFPLVWMRFKQPTSSDETSPYSAFEALLARHEPFVIINDEGLEPTQPAESRDEMKETARWMKGHKAELSTFVKAAIYIEPSPVKRLASNAFAIIYAKFWGHPMLITETKEEALSLANKLLSEP